MDQRDIRPNSQTYLWLLDSCFSYGSLVEYQKLHGRILKVGFDRENLICDKIIDICFAIGDINGVIKVFEHMPERSMHTWNKILSGFAARKMSKRVTGLVSQMLGDAINPTEVTFANALRACRALDLGEQIHTLVIKTGFQFNVYVCSVLIDMYAKHGKLDKALALLRRIGEEDVVAWTAMISGCTQHDLFDDAIKLFEEMVSRGIQADNIGFSSAISACAGIQALHQGQQIQAQTRGFDSEIEISNALITMYAKCGSISDAKRKFLEMPEKSDISWNAMITAYSQHGDGLEAVDHFENMKQTGALPNHVTFVGVLTACSHVGLVNEGLCYFESMSKEYGLVPKPEHYACVVDLLSRAGLLSRAKKFVEEMPIKPDAMVWRTLLSACVVHKDVELGEVAAQHLLDLEPEDSATYVLLSNMYAVSRKWNYRDRTRQMMKNRRVKKEPGRSWIEVKNKSHAFFVGDRLHPLADKIYEYLDKLNNRAAEIGYVQDHNSLLNETELEQKDPTQYVHSEKLAITFALLSLPDGFPIRVMKNLRVCNDCHNWIKFVSRISNREIVVRDAYRFHHFEEGTCSCKDFW
ncbi:Pentatricopeptide repeat-containing protein At4g13650 [Linum perenne]